MSPDKFNVCSSGAVGQKSRRGITLVEMLIGIGIFAIMAGSLYMIFANSIRFNRKVQVSENFYQDVRGIIDVLAADLENMVPYNQPADSRRIHTSRVTKATQRNINLQTRFTKDKGEPSQESSFKGEKESLSLVLPTATGLSQIRYYLAEPEDVKIYKILVQKVSHLQSVAVGKVNSGQRRMVLTREECPFPDAGMQSAGNQSHVEVLSENVLAGSLAFRYAKKDDTSNSDMIVWQELWGEAGHPLGLEMELVLVSPGSKQGTVQIKKKFLVPKGLKGEIPVFKGLEE